MNEVFVLIISHNQAKYLELMIKALKLQLPNTQRLFVLDRCSDNSDEILIKNHEKFIVKNEGNGFEAGATRDFGLKHLPKSCNVLFLDGDRIPYNLTENLLAEGIDKFSCCLLKTSRDYRKWFSDHFVKNPMLGTKYNNVATCGLLLSNVAINSIIAFNKGRLFHEVFDGNWGCEDDYLGDVLYYLKFTCGGFPKYVYVNGQIGDWQELYKKLGAAINRPKLLQLRANLNLTQKSHSLGGIGLVNGVNHRVPLSANSSITLTTC
jgi:glycosyltransferase involved in cell wall biosynthesis